MDAERFLSARENPRYMGGFGNGSTSTTNKAMAAEAAVQKPMPSILDRFKAMLKEREDEMRVSAGDDGDDFPPPTADEIVRLYELVLSELTFNSKPIITDLTIIAGEQREHGEGIADALCARILEVPVEQKLPSLYLLDSIVKNIGREYIRYFSSRLPEVFCEAYRQVHPNLHPAMRHLFKTWSTVFSPSVLRKIEAQLQLSPSENQPSSLTSLGASESPRPTHGIHINPKYLEARRHLEHSTADSNNQLSRGSSSTLKIYGQKPASGYDDYVSGNAEVVSSQVGAERVSSTSHKLLPSSATMLGKSSHLGFEHARSLSPPSDELAMHNSPGRLTEKVSPSHLGFEYGLGGIMGREEPVDGPRNQWSDGTYRRVGTSFPNNSEAELQGPRALIDAYGNDQRRNVPNNKPWKADINGIDNKTGTKSWQNTEEEEFDWEDMTPTLVSHNRSHDFISSSIPPRGNLRTKPGFGTHNAAPLHKDFMRGNWSAPSRNPVINDPSIIVEDAVPSVSLGRGSSSKIAGLQAKTAQFLGSPYPEDGRDFPHYLSLPSQRLPNLEGSARDNQRFPPSGGEQEPLNNSFRNAEARYHGSSSVAPRIGVASNDSWKSDALSASLPSSTVAWPPVNIPKSELLPTLPHLPMREQIRSQFNLTNASNPVLTKNQNKSFLPDNQFDSIRNNTQNSIKLPSFVNQQAGLISSNPQNPQVTSVEPQMLLSQDVRQNLVPHSMVSLPSLLPPLSHGYALQGHNTAIPPVLPNPVPGVHPLMPILSMSNSSLHLQGGGFPPLPSGPRPASSQMIPISQNAVPAAPNQPPGNAFSSLINSLMAQGLVSLTKQAPVQDSMGLEFNPDILKVRHEAAITALYADLPRQCTACGLRFKSQEDHSSHMDWHVTKNRISKNRKQKPSRKWFVSVTMWLTGTEALGTDAVPGFLPTESVVEKKDDEEFSVPADEDQNVCALCGEPFDDFYSDETEEWMYKGAVYMNAPSGSTTGLDRSQLGPIVHAKCMSESSAVPAIDSGKDEAGYTEEGSQRKRLRS